MARGLLTSQPRCLLAAGPRERAPAPARAPPPGSLRVSNPQHPGPRPTTHRSPPATARAALGTRSAPPPPPPEALLPPRRPCAPPPSGARPQSASPCGAQRPGWAGRRPRAGGPGRALAVAALWKQPPPGPGAILCARAFASGSIMNSEVHPHRGAGSVPCFPCWFPRDRPLT